MSGSLHFFVCYFLDNCWIFCVVFCCLGLEYFMKYFKKKITEFIWNAFLFALLVSYHFLSRENSLQALTCITKVWFLIVWTVFLSKHNFLNMKEIRWPCGSSDYPILTDGSVVKSKCLSGRHRREYCQARMF